MSHAFSGAVVLTNMMTLKVSQSVIFFCSFALQLQRVSFSTFPQNFHAFHEAPILCNPNSGSQWVQLHEFPICAHQKFIFHASGQHKSARPVPWIHEHCEKCAPTDIWYTRIRSGWHICQTWWTDLIEKNLIRAFAPNNKSRSFTRHVASRCLYNVDSFKGLALLTAQ